MRTQAKRHVVLFLCVEATGRTWYCTHTVLPTRLVTSKQQGMSLESALHTWLCGWRCVAQPGEPFWHAGRCT